MKRVFIIHGWDGYPEEGWFPSVRTELEERGFSVEVPNMPDGDSSPEIDKRVACINELVGTPNEETLFIGHSIGCQSIIRYLQTLPSDTKVGGAVYVAGWVSLTPMATRTEEERDIVKPWIETPIDFEKVKTICPQSVAIFARDDEFVPIENAGTYRDKLGAEVIILEKGGHLGGDSGVTNLPEVVEAIAGFE